jgi:hypothetical protein
MNKTEQTPDNHKQAAGIESLRRTRESLAGIDLKIAAERGGLDIDEQGRARINLLGRSLLVTPTLDVVSIDEGPVSNVDQQLVLRYIGAKRVIAPTGHLVAYRDLPGGRFYAAPVEKRTSRLLIRAFGNSSENLRSALKSIPHDPLDIGDVSARIPALGRLNLTIIYRIGDEEFSPTADVLYDSAISHVLNVDETAALATNLCVSLMRAAPRQ